MKANTLLALVALLPAVVRADDLYRITVDSEDEALILRNSPARAVFALSNGYLVLIDNSTANVLSTNGLGVELLDIDVGPEELAVDRRRDDKNIGRYPLVLQDSKLRVFRVDVNSLEASDRVDLLPVGRRSVKISYNPPVRIDEASLLADVDLWDLIDRVERDSVEAYLYRLQAFHRRLTGTDSCFAASAWIKEKFESFGYTDVVFDPFEGSQLWDYIPVMSRNVIATKVGTRYPDLEIIVGAHLDAVPDCPGADDDGSGTAGVLEIARVLADVETEVTFKFIGFDSEESWMWGSYHYADSVAAEGANILYMMNLDMIGHYDNDAYADLYYGVEDGYARLWSRLADSLVGIYGYLSGQAPSDHLPFIDNGYDVIFVQERNFSTEYHQPSDSTTYINFDYMTRMIQASLATAYTVNLALPPVTITDLFDAGDGQAMEVHWLPGDPERIDHYELAYAAESSSSWQTLNVHSDSVRYLVQGLVEGIFYNFHVLGVDSLGRKSITYNNVTGAPRLRPALPAGLSAEPLLNAIRLAWMSNNSELDFDHYSVIRDGALLPAPVYDTFFIDSDPSLGSDFHDYLVIAVDDDGYFSDTTGVIPVTTRAVTLDEGRILAINRTGRGLTLSDSSITEDFMLEALDGLDFDYLSDPCLHSVPGITRYTDLIGYEVVVIGAESGKGYDDLGGINGILDYLADYLTIGGKVVVFGRWGDLTTLPADADTIVYYGSQYDDPYYDYFSLYGRVRPLTSLDFSDLTLKTDFVGAHRQVTGYPDLVWDSLATANHTARGISFKVKDGVPCPSFPLLSGSQYDVIYTYDSGNDSTFTEGRPLGWRSLDEPYRYVLMDVPLSFMQRDSAVAALLQAVSDLGIDLNADRDGDGVLDVDDNCRNTYNPDQLDSDLDGVGDVCDVCAGYDDLVDGDDDGVPDGCDACPGFNDLVDPDEDGVPSGCDNCPSLANGGQEDVDGDGVGDVCDVCPGHDDAVDSDEDGVPDGCDICPGFNDLVDPDEDGLPSGCDNCPTTSNAGQEDDDGDGVGNVCDVCPGHDDAVDSDEDGVPDGCDICPGFNDIVDPDEDGIPTGCDNCAYVYNPGQEDSDGDGTGDSCQTCCGLYYSGYTGNCNCSEDSKITLADITRLIDRIYISKEDLCCEENGNVNGSLDGKLTLADITALIDHVYISKSPTAACP